MSFCEYSVIISHRLLPKRSNFLLNLTVNFFSMDKVSSDRNRVRIAYLTCNKGSYFFLSPSLTYFVHADRAYLIVKAVFTSVLVGQLADKPSLNTTMLY